MLFVGIDWSDTSLDFHLRTAAGEVLAEGQVRPDVEGMARLFVKQSRHQCSWAQAFYERQRRSGHKHHAALRALAHRWLKILLALKRSQQRYNEEIFLHSQRRYRLQKPTLYAGG